MEAHADSVAHYAQENLGDAICAAIEADGKTYPPSLLTTFEMVDEFHTRSRQTTVEVVRLMDYKARSPRCRPPDGLGELRYIALFGCGVDVDLHRLCRRCRTLIRTSPTWEEKADFTTAARWKRTVPAKMLVSTAP